MVECKKHRTLDMQDEQQTHESVLFSTTWSEPEKDFDRRACRAYLHLLIQLEWAGKILLVIFFLSFVIGASALLLGKNFEQIIFTDGTEVTCLFDTETGQIIKSNGVPVQ